MSSITPIDPVSSLSSAVTLNLYRTVAPIDSPAGKLAYQQLQNAIESGSLLAAQQAYAALQLAAAASRATPASPG
jgi:hypothetical protein